MRRRPTETHRRHTGGAGAAALAAAAGAREQGARLARRTRYLNKKSLAETLALFVDSIATAPRSQRVAVEDSLGRVTVAPVFAIASVPHYHGAAMDGIAVRAEDTFGASEAHPVRLLPLTGKAVAKAVPARRFAYVDTGHPLPRWADAVVMIEHVVPAGDGALALHAAATPWQHVRLVGEDIVATEPLLPRSHVIRPYDIGALLAAGLVEIEVAARPTVAIIPTGSELVQPGEGRAAGAIVEFNSRVAAAFITEWGGEARRRRPVADDPKAIERAVRAAAAKHDVVVIIAGSSAGERDFTVPVLQKIGEVLVHGVDVMPGKPAICARIGDTPVLGLPGYPVSAIVICQQILHPLVARLQGRRATAAQVVRALVPRKLPSRLGTEEFVRVSVGRVGAQLVANPLARGAGVITTMVRADGFVRVPSRSEGINAGETVDVELLRSAEDIENTIVFSGSHDLAIGVLDDCLRRRWPELKISSTSIGSLGGLVALQRGEAHLVGSHLLDPATGEYNLPDIRRTIGSAADIRIVHMLVREQGLICARGNRLRIRSLRDLTRAGVRFVNRQPGAGTRVLLDYQLQRLRIRPERIAGYEREEYTHMAVAVAVASDLADCGLGIRSAASALGLDFVPIEREEYDLVLRADFARSPLGERLLAALRSSEFATAVTRMGGYDTSRTGVEKPLSRQSKRQRRPTPARRR